MTETETAVSPQGLKILEGLLFLAGEVGLDLWQLQAGLPEYTREELETGLCRLKEDCADRGIDLVELAGRWRFVARAEVFPYARELFREVRPASLSPAALETLAVIAYRQPITRVQIEEIRGVACDTILKKLLARGFIEARDRLDAVGRPLLYKVTDTFLDAFSLDTLQSLPELSEPQEPATLFEDVQPLASQEEQSASRDSQPGSSGTAPEA